MSFLVPLFLVVGAGAIAVPIIVHLTHRERREPVAFPSVMLQERVPFRTHQRQRIRNWILFALRVAALALIAAAFARPYLTSGVTPTAAATRDVVVLLDQSGSMMVGERWLHAQQAADSILRLLSPDDDATLVLFDERARAVPDEAGGRAGLLAAVGSAQPRPRATHYAAALQVGRDLLAVSERAHRGLVLVTDMQRVGWREGTDVRLPDGVRFDLVDVSRDDPVNAALTEVTVEPSGSGARNTILARVAATAGEPGQVTVRLELDAQAAGAERVPLQAGRAALVQFEGLPAPQRPLPGMVRIGEDGLPPDNAFYFVASPRRPVHTLLVESPRASANGTLFVRRALEVARDPALATQQRPVPIGAHDLAGKDLVIVNDASVDAAGSALRQFVERGGGLFIIAGPRIGRLPSWLGVGVDPPIVDRLEGGGSGVGVTDYGHPVFRLFAAPGSGDFSTIRVLRYRRLVPDSGVRVLARFDDGAPALVEQTIGAGRVVVWASSMDNQWNDVVVRPVFLPLLHRLATHLAQWQPTPTSYVVGRALDLHAMPQAASLLDASKGEDLIVETPSGSRTVLTPDVRTLVMEEVGLYRIRRVRGDPTLMLAANADREESNLSRIDPAVFVAAVTPQGPGDGAVAEGAATLSPVDRERRQGLWWYLLMAALGLLMVEATAAHVSQERR